MADYRQENWDRATAIEVGRALERERVSKEEKRRLGDAGLRTVTDSCLALWAEMIHASTGRAERAVERPWQLTELLKSMGGLGAGANAFLRMIRDEQRWRREHKRGEG